MTDESGQTAKPLRRSYSQLSLWLKCREAFYWRYVERVPDAPAIWNIGGVAFHECAERFLRGDFANPDDVFLVWAEAWRNAMAEVVARHPDAPPLDQWRKANRGSENAAWWAVNGPVMVENFIAWWRNDGQALRVLELHDENGEGAYPGLEQRLEVELGGVPVVVIPDALVVDEHGQIDILDYKSGRTLPDSPLQLRIYDAGIQAADVGKATWGLFYSTRSASAIPWDLTRYSVAEVGEMFAAFDEAEKAGDYRLDLDHDCRECRPYRKNREESA